MLWLKSVHSRFFWICKLCRAKRKQKCDICNTQTRIHTCSNWSACTTSGISRQVRMQPASQAAKHLNLNYTSHNGRVLWVRKCMALFLRANSFWLRPPPLIAIKHRLLTQATSTYAHTHTRTHTQHQCTHMLTCTIIVATDITALFTCMCTIHEAPAKRQSDKITHLICIHTNTHIKLMIWWHQFCKQIEQQVH